MPFNLWRERIATETDAGDVDLYSEYVPPGETWYIKNVAIKTDNGLSPTGLFAIRTSGYDHVLTRISGLIQGLWSNTQLETYLREGERLLIRYTGGQTGDRVDIHITGRKYCETFHV